MYECNPIIILERKQEYNILVVWTRAHLPLSGPHRREARESDAKHSIHHYVALFLQHTASNEQAEHCEGSTRDHMALVKVHSNRINVNKYI